MSRQGGKNPVVQLPFTSCQSSGLQSLWLWFWFPGNPNEDPTHRATIFWLHTRHCHLHFQLYICGLSYTSQCLCWTAPQTLESILQILSPAQRSQEPVLASGICRSIWWDTIKQFLTVQFTLATKIKVWGFSPGTLKKKAQTIAFFMLPQFSWFLLTLPWDGHLSSWQHWRNKDVKHRLS